MCKEFSGNWSRKSHGPSSEVTAGSFTYRVPTWTTVHQSRHSADRFDGVRYITKVPPVDASGPGKLDLLTNSANQLTGGVDISRAIVYIC